MHTDFSFSSVQSLSCVRLFVTPWIAACQASLSITNSRSLLKFQVNSCPSSRWWHPAISSSVVPFSSCPQSLPASGYFSMSQLFAWGGQSVGVSASAPVLPMKTQDWSPLGWTGWISLQSKGLSRVFFNTIVQKHQFFSPQLSSQSNSHYCPSITSKDTVYSKPDYVCIIYNSCIHLHFYWQQRNFCTCEPIKLSSIP